MTLKTLLRELETLPHPARMKRMVEVGREAGSDLQTQAALDELERGGFYERRLALQSCFGSRDGARAMRALHDPSRLVRGLALKLAALLGESGALQTVLLSATYPMRRALLKMLVRRRREVVDGVLEVLAAQRDPQFDRLLAFGSSELVARFLPETGERASGGDWARLARFHPLLAASHSLERARAATRLDARLSYHANAVLPVLADSHPDEALAFVRALLKHAPIHSFGLQALVQRRPNEMADLFLQTPGSAPISFDAVAHRLELSRLLALLEHRPQALSRLGRWFARLDARRRRAVYELIQRGWRDDDGALPREFVALLPRPEREAEARRHFALPALQTRPAQRLPFAALLPWEERLELLERFVRDPDPATRLVADESLLWGVRYERERLADALAFVLARKNEQDPIRGAMLRALGTLPPSAWQPEHLENLGQILRQALDASDLSGASSGAGEHLILRLLPRHPAWASAWLATWVRERGQIAFWSLSSQLSDADVKGIAPHLLPVAKAWETRERSSQLLGLAASLGRRLEVWDEFADLLERVVRDGASYPSASALNVLARFRRDRLPVLVPALLRADKSWITQTVVHDYLHRRRQDLLHDFLGRRAFSGRFGTGRTRFVLPFTSGFGRWLPGQQQVFADTLNGVTHDEARDSPALLHVIQQLAALPDVPPRRLVALAALANPKPVTRDAALRALARRDGGDGVPALLDALGDERARIAIYALRRALLEMPASRALELLRGVPTQRVTVAKEVVRLIGDLGGEDAFQALLLFDAQELQRDVRVALLRALWAFVERDETWLIFERAAMSADAAIATIVGRLPAERLSPQAARRLALLLAALGTNPDAKVRLDAWGRCASAPLADSDAILLPPLLRALESPLPDECRAAARAAFATYVGRESERIGEAARRICFNRRALHALMTELQTQFRFGSDGLRPSARAVLEALSDDPISLQLRVELAVAALPGDELAGFFAGAAQRGELHAQALMSGVQALEARISAATPFFFSAPPAEEYDSNWDDESDLQDNEVNNIQAAQAAIANALPPQIARELEGLEAALAASPDEGLRRLALAALLAQGHSARGWSDARLARLEAFRGDVSPLVAAAAQFTFVPAASPAS